MRLRVVFMAVCSAFVVALGLATPAFAHSGLVSSNPAEGAVLDIAPSSIELVFNEPVELRREDTRLTSGTGVDIAIGDVTVNGNVVTLTLDGDLGAGSHALQWSVASADGHPISGILRFTSLAGLTPTTQASAAPSTTAASSDEENASGSSSTVAATTAPAPTVAVDDPANDLADESSGTSPVVFVVGALVVLAVVGAIVVVMRNSSDDGDGHGHGSADSDAAPR